MVRALPIAVVGGGPAGSLAAAALAAAGQSVVVIEERPEWEKPCGGGVTDKALNRYPHLRAAATAYNPVRECELISPRGRCALLSLDRTLAIFSRRKLNHLLLERAGGAGAEVIHDRAVAVAAAADGAWSLELRGGTRLRAAAIVVATGARNPVRALPSPLPPSDWMATAGYYLPLERIPWPRYRIAVRFLAGVEGYIWSFPRGDHASVGICGKLGATPTVELRRMLERELDAWGIAWRGAPFYAHLLPAPSPAGLHRGRFAGASPHPWALIGDAGGLVDPITGEGLYYALRSGEMLGRAWSAGPSAAASAAYAAALRRELLPELAAAGALVRRFYHGRFLGDTVLERMILFCQHSPRFRQLLCDLFSGAQGCRGLRRRLWRQLAPSLWQLSPARGAS